MVNGLAVVTGASSGIGLELARCCAEDGYGLLICSDTAEIEEAARDLRAGDAEVETVQADLSTPEGVEAGGPIADRPVDALLANAGIGLGDAFLDQDLDRAQRVVDLNVGGTIALSVALRNELKDSGVTVTCLMAGATETDFFERAEMEDTKVGQADKADPAEVARQGYEAMQKGESGVVTGFMNKVQAAFSGIIPDAILAQMHRRMAEPGSGR
ncbi:MAG: SDR family NAD(P)-dependent oxidoreductase [Amaricoccus sp.]